MLYIILAVMHTLSPPYLLTHYDLLQISYELLVAVGHALFKNCCRTLHQYRLCSL